MAKVADALASLIEEFRGERSCTNASAVGFHDAIDVADFVGANAKTCASTRTDGVRRGNERIGTEVNIEHGSLSTLAKHRLAFTQEVVDLVFAIDNGELLHVFDALHPLALHVGDVIVGKAQGTQRLLMTSLVSLIFSFEVIEDVTHAQAVAAHLVGIGGTDALTRGANAVLAL